MLTEPPTLHGRSVDFSLESTAGGTRSLSQHRGSVVVVFYEARDRTGDNQQLKRALAEPDAQAGVIVIAAGDMRAFDLPAARPVARTAARLVAARHGFEILLDWKGALTRPPFGLDAAASNVLVIGRSGAVAFRHTGLLGSADITRFFAALRRARHESGSSASSPAR